MIGWINRLPTLNVLHDLINRHLESKKSLGAVKIVVSTLERTIMDILKEFLLKASPICNKLAKASPNSGKIQALSSNCPSPSEIILSSERWIIKSSLETLTRIAIKMMKKVKKRRTSSQVSHFCKRKSMRLAASSRQ